MKKTIRNAFLMLAVAAGITTANAEFKDVKVDLTKGNLLTETEIADKSLNTFGLAVAADGTVTRVAADDASAVCTVTGKYHSDDHGWGNFSSTIAVNGPVKVSMGTCAWGGDVTIKNAAGEVVGTFNTNTGACFHGDKVNNIASGYYKGTEATTLTISGGSYTPYFAVEAVDLSTLVEDYYVTFADGGLTFQGVLPEKEKVESGKTLVIPANYTMYVEGKTLTGWSDGAKTYKAGDELTVTADVTLTPVFTNNTTSLDKRKDAVTVKWNFRRDQGAPTVSWQGKDNLIWVAQAEVNGETIDVVLPFSTASGKCANGNWTDWAQLNGGTVFYVPVCKGAVLSVESYSATTTTTFDGEKIGDGSKTPSYTYMGVDNTADLVIGDGSYWRYIQIVLPYVAPDVTGVTYTNEAASVIWAFNSAENYLTDIEVAPEGTFSVTAFDPGDNVLHPTVPVRNGTTVLPDIKFVEFQSTKGASDILSWNITPAKGLTFTPTKVSFYVGRDGTDGSGADVTVQGKVGETVVKFASITPHRLNKTQAEDKFGKSDDYTTHFEYELTAEQQAQLASGEGFSLFMNNGYGTTKGVILSDVQIHGLLNGTAEAVEKFTVSADVNIEGAAEISVYPKADKYDKDSEVKLTAKKNFGYTFVNWTDQDGKVVSENEEWSYTVAANSVFTANYEKLNTYELKYDVEGGANLYMVQPTPMYTLVDGKKMYEEGTTVTLKASSNTILTFTNWNDGQSSSEITVKMDADRTDLVAVYSALDYIVGWDFYQPGNNGRPADFFAADNDDVTLVMRNAEGNVAGWLEKSTVSAGGYESLPGAAVNWQTGTANGDVGHYYWQTRFNAEAFTDIKVSTSMLYNYNAYQKQNIEYSLDGENWTTIGTITIEGTKKAVSGEFTLPAAANNQKEVFVRIISDKTSTVDGTSSKNDGIALGATFIYGTAQLVNDGTAPVLVNQVPEEGANTASINGKIVLTFDEKVKVKEGTVGKLGNLELQPVVTGKTVMFAYKNLAYATDYTFTLAAGAVMDLTDNAMDKAITIKFTTKTRPVVEKAGFDAEVRTADEFVAALAEAAKREDTSKRFRIFLHNGTYKLPASKTATKTGSDNKAYPDPTTYIATPNVSFIGESMDGVIITNTVPAGSGANVLEGIGKGDVISLQKTATNTYWQNLTIKSAMGDAAGRDIELNDQSDKTIFKDACLWGYQDTYVSNNQQGRFYFEGGVLRGRTDYLCGKGDVFYKDVTLRMIGEGGYITAPSQCREWGYVFKDCEIIGDKDGVDGNFTLGRPWGSGTPSCLWIDTKMTVKPSAAGWNEMSGGYPKRFAEYNSMTATGTVIDLKDRKTTFGDGFSNNPVLTKAEADAASYTAVMGSDDDWDPAASAEQAPAPTRVYVKDGVISWDNNDYASCWAVLKDGEVIAIVTEPVYDVNGTVAADTRATNEKSVYSVRAANEMGGFGEEVAAIEGSVGIDALEAAEVVSTAYYTIDGVRVSGNVEGVLLRVDTLANGREVTTKVIIRK